MKLRPESGVSVHSGWCKLVWRLLLGLGFMAAKDKEVGKLDPGNTNVALPPELQGQLGKRLRESYSDLVNQPVPDKFLALLEELKKSEPTGGKK